MKKLLFIFLLFFYADLSYADGTFIGTYSSRGAALNACRDYHGTCAENVTLDFYYTVSGADFWYAGYIEGGGCPPDQSPDGSGLCADSTVWPESCGTDVPYIHPNFGESCGTPASNPNDCENAAHYNNGQWTCVTISDNEDCADGWTLGTSFAGDGSSVSTCAAPGQNPNEEPEENIIPDEIESDIPDTDDDGTPDHQDDDIDGDGINNNDDHSPGGDGSGEGSGTASGDCEVPPACTGDPQQCAILRQEWMSMCYVEDYISTDEGFYNEESASDFETRLQESFDDFKSDIQNSEVYSGVDNFFNVSLSGSCPVYSVDTWVFSITLDQWCSGIMPWSIIAGILIAISSFIAARIALS